MLHVVLETETDIAERAFNWPLLTLAIGAFGIGATGFAPMGLLPAIAKGGHVSIATMGMPISAYAIGVTLGAPIMTLVSSRLGKQAALMLLMAIFTVGNLLSALAPDYNMLLLARLVTSLNHGAFLGLGAIVAASMVPKEKQASAVAAMFMGLAIAHVGGVPVAAWIGQQLGWRMAFAGIAVLGLVAIAALRLACPKDEPGSIPDIRRELSVLAHPSVLLAMATTVMGAAAMSTFYTYIAPVLVELTGASDGFVTLALVLTGVGFTIGNALGGRLADWSLDGATKIFFGALAIIMAALPFALYSHAGAAIGVLLWGAATFAIMAPTQMRVMQAASEAPGFASSINVSAFNLGNALGAAIGGDVISLGFGYAAVPVAGGVLAAGGLATALLGRHQPAPERCAA